MFLRLKKVFSDPSINKLNPVSILIIYSSLFCLMWLNFPANFDHSDGKHYTRIAYNIASNSSLGCLHSEGNTIFDHRLGLVAPISIFYKIFGMNILSTNVWLLLSYLLIMFTVWFSLPDNKSKIIGLTLCFLSVQGWASTRELRPDIVASAFMSFSYALMIKRNIFIKRNRYYLYPVLSILSLFIAFLAKLTAYFALPLWGMMLYRDFKSKQFILLKEKFYYPAFYTFLILGISYLILCFQIWGNPLERFFVVQSYSGQHSWSFETLTIFQQIARLTFLPIIKLLTIFHIFPILLIFTFFINSPIVKDWLRYLIIMLFLLFYGTTSFSTFEPMPLIPRFFHIIFAPLFILVGFLLSNIELRQIKLKKYSTIAVLTITIGMNFFPLYSYVKREFGLYYNQPKNYGFAEKNSTDFLKNYLTVNKNNTILICSDKRTPEYLVFYFSMKVPDNLSIIDFKSLKKLPVKEILESNLLVYMNESASDFLFQEYGQKSAYSYFLNYDSKKIFEENQIKILYIDNKILKEKITKDSMLYNN